MLKQGVVLYGAGKQGIAAVNELENMGIHIAAIADRQIGKNCGRFCAVSIGMLCEQAKNFKYKSNKGWFDDGDAGLLHSMILEYKPKRIIEIGSGFSTCVMLDTNEYWLDNQIEITCIEPYPHRLMENIRNKEKIEIRSEFVQHVPLEVFDSLEANDILFIDSSHVVKAGGDIIWEYFHIIPRLKDGVIIHIHDIIYPFTYPERWILQGRAYTEAFILRAFLMNNNRYEILFFNSMMIKKCYEEYRSGWNKEHELSGFGSIWFRKR